MAVLQNIRNRGGIFIMIFVGVALFLFIVDPSTFNGLFHKTETDVAKINGENVSYKEFNYRLNEAENFVKAAKQTSSLDAETESQLREQIWQEIQNHYLIGRNFNQLGIGVSDAEMEDMLWGQNIHNIIKTNFSNPQTGEFDTLYVRQFFEQAELDNRTEILSSYLKFQIKQDREMTKYYNLVNFYTPTALAKENYELGNAKADFEYIALRYRDINDDEIKVDESEMKAYYKDHAYLYQAEESTREIEYVVFPIVPNAEDSAATYKQMEELRSRFYKTDDDFKFVQLHSEENIEKPYFTEADVPGGLGATVFENKEIGYISDIFSQDTSYLMFKVNDFITIPDSVKASHILITPDTARGYQEVFTILDSLRTEVKNGANFAELAKTWSMGPSAPKGGDLGWFKQGAMVPEFNDACFYGKIGDYPIVATQFGIHLINIEKQNGGEEHAVLAVVEKHITASTNSYNKIYADASNFASQNNTKEKFDKAIADNKMVKKIASNIKESDQEISGLKQARSIIKWAFNNELSSISNVEEMPEANCFIVAKISQIKEKGTIDFEYVKDEIKPIVIRKKKAEMLKEKINNNMNSDINAMASSLNTQVETAQNISFNSFSVPKLGIEPNLISAVAYEPIEKVSKPIEGNNAIYVVEVTKRTTPEAKEDFNQEKNQLTTSTQSRVNYELMKALKKASEIEDKRSIFF